MSFLLRIPRKEALIQVANDILRHNSSGTPTLVHNQPTNHLTSTSIRHNPNRNRYNVANLFQLSCQTRFMTTTTTTSTPPPATSGTDHVDFSTLSPLNQNIVSKMLRLSVEFLQDHNFRFSKDGTRIVFEFSLYEREHLSNRAIEYSIKCSDSKRATFHEVITPNDPKQRFQFLSFGSHLHEESDAAMSNDDAIMIFDNPFDALAYHHETSLPAIVFKFPKNGDEKKISDVCRRLNRHYGKIYYWSNNVEFCRQFRNSCIRHFDAAKLYRVTEDQSSYEMLHKKRTAQPAAQNYGRIFERSTLIDRPGILHVNQTGEQLYRFLNDPGNKGRQWTRYVKLNEQLKGHRTGELTIVTGPTGCGKTTFVSEYSLDLCAQGVRTLWGSFELKYMSLEKMMMIQLAGKQFDVTNRQEFNDAFDRFSQLPLFFLNFHGQTEIEAVLTEAKHAVLMHGVEHLIIDNLQFMLGLSPDSAHDRFHRQDFVLGMIRQFATQYNCHVTLVAHPRKEKEEVDLSNNSLYGGVKASQEADNILILMNRYNPRYKCQKYIQITKNRAYGNLGVVPLYFDKNSLCFSSTPQPKQQPQQPQQSTNSSQDFFSRGAESRPPSSQHIDYDSFKQFLKDQDRPSH